MVPRSWRWKVFAVSSVAARRMLASEPPASAQCVSSSRPFSPGGLPIPSLAGVKLLFGSDTPANEGIGNPPGLNGRLELTHWAEAGGSLASILRAATLETAKTFHLHDRGTIEPGKRADLLLLRTNPLENVSAYDTIETVILNGEPIQRASLVSQN